MKIKFKKEKKKISFFIDLKSFATENFLRKIEKLTCLYRSIHIYFKIN